MEFQIPLNKFEKYDLVIKLHKEGKTYREIAHIAHVSLRDIKPILKKYERKLETKKEEANNQIKKLSISSQAFKLFREGKKPIDVKIELDIPFKKTIIFWAQYLKSIRMFESFEFYQEHSYDIPSLLSIANFMKRNNVCGINIVNVLRVTVDTAQLYKTNSGLKAEIAKLRQMKNDYQKTMVNHQLQPLQPLPLNKSNYNY